MLRQSLQHESSTKRPKARGLAQHGGPPGWLEESDTARGCDFVRDGRSMPPALMEHSTCPGLGLICYKMYTKHRHARKACMVCYSSRPMPTHWSPHLPSTGYEACMLHTATLFGTPTKRQVSKRQVSKRLVSKRLVSKRPIFKFDILIKQKV